MILGSRLTLASVLNGCVPPAPLLLPVQFTFRTEVHGTSLGNKAVVYLMLEQEIGCVNAQGCTDQLRSLEKQKGLSGRENSNYEHGCGLKYIMMKIHVS